MYDFENATICARFFQALDCVKAQGKTNYTAFCEKYGINRRNMLQQKANPSRQIFKPSWMLYLVRDFGVSADWLITGRGEMMRIYDEKSAKKLQEIKTILAMN